MKERVSTYPGRVKLIPVEGQENIYDMERADSPIDEGTPLNKATLLTDETAALAGLGENAVPDEVLSRILARMMKRVTVTLLASDWDGEESPFTQTVSVSGVSEDETEQGVFISPASASLDDWNLAQVLATEQRAGALVFKSKERLAVDLTVNVLIQGVL